MTHSSQEIVKAKFVGVRCQDEGVERRYVKLPAKYIQWDNYPLAMSPNPKETIPHNVKHSPHIVAKIPKYMSNDLVRGCPRVCVVALRTCC